jgi:hypothetical protein
MKNTRPRAIIVCISIALILFLSAPLPAQQLAGKKADAQNQNIPIENNQIKLGLKSTLVLGLKNNLDLAFQSYNPQIVGTGIERAESVYDTRLTTDFNKQQSRAQVGSVLAGGSSLPITRQQYWNLNSGVQKKFTPGTSAELKLTNQQYIPTLHSRAWCRSTSRNWSWRSPSRCSGISALISAPARYGSRT